MGIPWRSAKSKTPNAMESVVHSTAVNSGLLLSSSSAASRAVSRVLMWRVTTGILSASIPASAKIFNAPCTRSRWVSNSAAARCPRSTAPSKRSWRRRMDRMPTLVWPASTSACAAGAIAVKSSMPTKGCPVSRGWSQTTTGRPRLLAAARYGSSPPTE